MSSAFADSPIPAVVLRMTLKVDDLDTFIERYARHLDGDRIFIFSKTPQPVGTPVRFGLYLTNGELILQGRGVVMRVQEPSPNLRRPPGVELQFVPLDERSKTLVEFMQAVRSESRLNPPVGSGDAIGASPPPARSKDEDLATLPPVPLPETSSLPLPLPLPPPSLVLSPSARAAARSAPPVPSNATTRSTQMMTAVKPIPASPPSLPVGPPSPAALSREESTMTVDAAIFAPVPVPVVARVPLPPGAPAADPALGIPANPFSEVPDGAIEYFVEWSLEQNTGSSVDTKATFANVAMELPHPDEPLEPARNRPTALILGGVFLAGALAGVAVYRVARGGTAAVAAVPSTATAAPAPIAAPTPIAAASPIAAPATVTPTTTAPAAAPPTKTAAVTPTPAAPAPTAAEPTPAPAPAPAKETPHPATPAPLPVAVAPKPAPPAPAPADEGGALALNVRTTPPGAQIQIDGKTVGTSPAVVKVAAGPHQLRLRRERYVLHEANVRAPGDVDVNLKRPIATLAIRTSPPGAAVEVGKDVRGTTPAEIKLPAFETYKIKVRFADGRVATKQLYLQPPGQSINATLPPIAKPAPTTKPTPPRK